MAYDAAESEVVLFGGAKLSAIPEVYFGDTWTFHNGSWVNVTATAGTAPLARVGAGMTYDASDGYLLLFGGNAYPSGGGYGGWLNDTWKFQWGRWSEINPTGAVPTADEVGGFHLVYDSKIGTPILLVSNVDSEPWGGLTMTYHAGVWADLGPNGTTSSSVPTPGFEGIALADDPPLGGLLAYGGTDWTGKAAYNETELFANGSWTNITANVTGGAFGRSEASAAYDVASRSLVLYGGYGFATGLEPLNQTWGFAGETWTNLSGPQGPLPGPASQLVWDGGGNFTLLFAGDRSETWGWGPQPELFASFSYPVPSSCGGGFNVTFTSDVTGGLPPYTYRWGFGDGSNGSASANPTHEYASPPGGGSDITLVAGDSDGQSASTSEPLVVDFPPCAHPVIVGSGGVGSGWSAWLIAGTIGAAAVVGVAALPIVIRRRGDRKRNY